MKENTSNIYKDAVSECIMKKSGAYSPMSFSLNPNNLYTLSCVVTIK